MIMLLLKFLCGFNCICFGGVTKVMCIVVCVSKLRVPLGTLPPSWWMVYLLLLVFAALPVVICDNLALLSGTLRTFQRAGCDDEVVTLRCPHGTSISVQVAQYGKSAPSKAVCPQHSSTPGQQELPPNVTCLWPNALQTVVEACQKKRQCKFQTSPKTFGGDPCPGVRKYVEVAYKCRPYEFRSKVACENDVVPLKCNPNSRIAVYSASYGRTEYESIQCPQPQGVPEETCLVSYATETVMNICHGKRRCTLSADPATFGNPCKPESRMYLKVVYTCGENVNSATVVVTMVTVVMVIVIVVNVVMVVVVVITVMAVGLASVDTATAYIANIRF
ncbi:protein eva-1 homolog C [Cryptotermes secundus]|uniref:protein eva-1 homolog C n=1 Tax=Cryptotermes secundus TaxID=105785 RepID=UPI001454C246|nr:protein eva-1 homolog C [Cryptotermes secundus]